MSNHAISRIEFLRMNHPAELNEEQTHVVVNRGEKASDVVRHIVAITQPWKAENGGMMFEDPEQIDPERYAEWFGKI